MIHLNARPLRPEEGISCRLCGVSLSSLKQYRRHVGRHQEQLSLFALPSLDKDGEGDDESDESDQSGGGDSLAEEVLHEESESGSVVGSKPLVEPVDLHLVDKIARALLDGPVAFKRLLTEHPEVFDQSLLEMADEAIDFHSDQAVLDELRTVLAEAVRTKPEISLPYCKAAGCSKKLSRRGGPRFKYYCDERMSI